MPALEALVGARLGSSPNARRERNSAVCRLANLASLSSAEAQIVEDLCANPRSFPTRHELQSAGVVGSPSLLLSGWACYHRVLGDGRRQIVSFLLPGDFIGPVLNSGLPASCSAIALTPVTTTDARPLIALATNPAMPPALVNLMHCVAAHDEQGLHDQIVRVGRQTAYERMVHLMLDLYARLRAAGLCDGDSFSLPLTQETLADALGLSIVHVNRTLQQIRRDGLLQLSGGQVMLLQPDRMAALADWHPVAGLRE